MFLFFINVFLQDMETAPGLYSIIFAKNFCFVHVMPIMLSFVLDTCFKK